MADGRRLRALAWLAAAVLACLSVTLINGGGLSYFDTGGYLAQGHAALQSLGLSAPPGTGTDPGGGAAAIDDGVVVGSRSAIYSVLIAAAHRLPGLQVVPVIHTLLFIAAVWLPVHVAVRTLAPGAPVAPRVAVPVLLAGLGSLPFYIGYLMPDIFAPILLLAVASLAAFGRAMTWPERSVAVVLGLGAVVTHPSHLLMAALLVPLVGLAALILSRRGWWLPPVLVALMVAGGLAERALFVSAVKSIRASEVIYQPFLTVRMIADGPGLRLLAERCPDPEMPACALYEALQRSDNPRRMTASHIMFETSPELGSYRLLPLADQTRIANSQVRFFLRVLAHRPVDTTLSFVRNTLVQAAVFNSVGQTIPTSSGLASIDEMTGGGPASLHRARLLDRWQHLEAAGIDTAHGVLYALAGLGLVLLCATPRGGPPAPLRVFALVVIAGIMVNALVCGGISQPSDRYGARVAFLLPLTLGMLVMFRPRP